MHGSLQPAENRHQAVMLLWLNGKMEEPGPVKSVALKHQPFIKEVLWDGEGIALIGPDAQGAAGITDYYATLLRYLEKKNPGSTRADPTSPSLFEQHGSVTLISNLSPEAAVIVLRYISNFYDQFWVGHAYTPMDDRERRASKHEVNKAIETLGLHDVPAQAMIETLRSGFTPDPSRQEAPPSELNIIRR